LFFVTVIAWRLFKPGQREPVIQGLAGVVTLKAAAEGRTCQKLQVSAAPLGMSKGHLAEFNRGINPEGISSCSSGLAFFSQLWEEKKSNS